MTHVDLILRYSLTSRNWQTDRIPPIRDVHCRAESKMTDELKMTVIIEYLVLVVLAKFIAIAVTSANSGDVFRSQHPNKLKPTSDENIMEYKTRPRHLLPTWTHNDYSLM